MNAHNPSMPQAGDLIGGRFRIQEILGTGGFGTVYRALQENMGRDVALKFLTPNIAKDPVAVERFRREAFHVSQLRHPNTITIYDYGHTEDGQVYMVLEFLQGVSLADTIQNEGALTPSRGAHIFIQVLQSLSEAHQRGLVHRDLKPENIYLCEMFGELDYVKVLDFGVAKMTLADEEDIDDGAVQLTKAGRIFGTPMYMAPEQACAEPITTATDVYALGLLLFEILTGVAPVDGRNRMDVIHKQIRDQVPIMHVDMERSAIGQVIRKCCEKAPEARYPDAAALLMAFRQAIHQMQIYPAPTLAPPATPTPPQAPSLPPLVDDPGDLDATRLDSIPLAFLQQSSADTAQSNDISDVTVVQQPAAEDLDATRLDSIPLALLQQNKPSSPAPNNERTQQNAMPQNMADKMRHDPSPDLTKQLEELESLAPRYDLPLIGRNAELQSIQKLIQSCIEHATGKILLLESENGLGKSRLLQELQTRLDQQAITVSIAQFRRRGLPMEGFRDAFTHLLGISTDDASTNTHQTLDRFGILTPGEVEFLTEFVSPEASAVEEEIKFDENTTGPLHAHLEKLLVGLSERQPIVLILEDIHNSDSATLAFLEYLSLTLRTHSVPLFILLTSSSDQFSRSSEFEQLIHTARSNIGEQFTRMRLKPLHGRDLALLLDAIIPLEPALKERIGWLSQGVPLHALQIIRYLQSEDALIKRQSRWRLKSGTPRDIHLPPSLIQMMHLRVEQVIHNNPGFPHLQKTLQWLALLGMRPPVELLFDIMKRTQNLSAHDIERHINVLQMNGLIRSAHNKTLNSVEFTSSLLREAILDELHKTSTSQWFHRIAAEHKMAFYRARRVELPLIEIADHWRQAGVEENYRDALYAACKRSMKRFDLRGARNQYRELIKLLEARNEQNKMWVNAHLALSELARRFGEFGLSEEYYRRVLDSSAATGRSKGRALRGYAHLMTVQGRYKEATTYYSKSLDWSQQIKDNSGIAKALIGLSRVHLVQSDTRSGQNVRHRLEQMVNTMPPNEISGKILLHLAEASQRRGELNKRYNYLIKAKAAFEAIDEKQGLSDTLVSLGSSLMDSALEDTPNRLQQAGRILRQALELKRAIGDRMGVAEAFRYLGQLEIEFGDYDAAEELLQQGLKIHEALGAPYNIGATRNALGIIQLYKRNYPAAEVHFNRAIDLFKVTGDQIAIYQGMLNHGVTAINMGRWQQAQAILAEAKKISASQSTKLALFDLHNNLAIIAMWHGEFERAENLLNQTLQNLSVDGAAEDRAMARSLMGLLRCFQGHLELAALELGRAQADAEEINMDRLIAFCHANTSFYAYLSNSRSTYDTLVGIVRQSPILHSLDRNIWLELLEAMAIHANKNPTSNGAQLLQAAATFWLDIGQNTVRADKLQALAAASK